MKTMKTLLGIAAFLIFTAIGVNAQQNSVTNPQIVTQGTVKTYKVTSHTGYSLGWTVTGTNNTLTPSDQAETKVTWGAIAGDYILTLTEKNDAAPDGCPVPNLFYVRILGRPILQFASATSGSCADAEENIQLTYKFENGTDITTANGASYYPFTVTYNVVDPTTGINETRTLTVNSENDLQIALSGSGINGDRRDLDPYDVSRELTVTLNDDATITNGKMYITPGTIKANANTIYDVPETNPIVAVD